MVRQHDHGAPLRSVGTSGCVSLIGLHCSVPGCRGLLQSMKSGGGAAAVTQLSNTDLFMIELEGKC